MSAHTKQSTQPPAGDSFVDESFLGNRAQLFPSLFHVHGLLFLPRRLFTCLKTKKIHSNTPGREGLASTRSRAKPCAPTSFFAVTMEVTYARS